MTKTSGHPETPKEPIINWVELKAKMLKLQKLYDKLMGADRKWNRINRSFQVVFLSLSIPLYFLGSSEPSAREVVYYIWRVGIFGIWSSDIPYTCYNFVGARGLCSQAALQIHDYLDPSIALVGYVIGGAISLRIIAFCLERLEAGLGAYLLSGIDRFLPKPKEPNYHQYIGEVHMGDVFQGISNSTIVSRSKVEGAFNRLQESGENESAELLIEIGKRVSDANNAAAVRFIARWPRNFRSLHMTRVS